MSSLVLDSLWLLFLSASTLPSPSFSLSRFSPTDNLLVNCGSPVDSLVEDARLFLGDAKPSSRFFVPTRSSFRLVDDNPVPGTPWIHHTAQVFTEPSKYVFPIRDRGTHVVRLNFHRFNSPVVDVNDVEFQALVDGYVFLSNFTGARGAEKEEVVVSFWPRGRAKLSFVTAIEVISASKDLILEDAQFVGDGKVVDFEGLNRQAFEVFHRLNVGGSKVTPFNE